MRGELSRVLSLLLRVRSHSALRRVRLLSGVRLRSTVGLLWLLGDRGRGVVVLSDDGLVDGATALDAEDDEEDPGDELADTADDEAGDTAVELAVVAAAAGVVAVVIVVAVVVVAVVVPAAGGVGQVGADESTADDEHHHGGDEEADGPPFVEPRGLLHWGGGVHRVRHGEV